MTSSSNVTRLDQRDQFHAAKRNRAVSGTKPHEGFSERLNKFIDIAGEHLDIPERGKGRGSWLAVITGHSRTATSTWLERDTVPQDETLDALTVLLLSHIPGKHQATRIKAWLLYGDSIVKDPFARLSAKELRLLPIAVKVVNDLLKKGNLGSRPLNLEKATNYALGIFQDTNITDISDVTAGHRRLISEYLKLITTLPA